MFIGCRFCSLGDRETTVSQLKIAVVFREKAVRKKMIDCFSSSFTDSKTRRHNNFKKNFGAGANSLEMRFFFW